MRKKNLVNKFCRTIKIEFIPERSAKIMLINNCRYRHWLYNKGVEYVKKHQELHPDGHLKVNLYDLLGYLRHTYEFTSINRPDYLEEYDYYFRGIVECVVDDLGTTIERIITNRSLGKSSDIHFIEYDPNKISFRFKNKIDTRRPMYENGLYSTNRLILTENPYLVGLKINDKYSKRKEYMGLHLRESIRKFNINFNKIKEIGIKFHNEKWWLCLIVDCTEEFSKIKIKHRKKVSGIDLGEQNPIVIYDGNPVIIPKHLRFPKDRITKLEVRLKRLRRVMDKKRNPDMDKFHQSKNYYKVLAKFHKTWERIVNIKKDWHFKLCHWIVMNYKNIVVDEFHGHIVNVDSNYPTQLRKRVNHSMYRRGMFDFTMRLIHMCRKYGTNYYKSLIDTTNTCSDCGNVNVHKMKLDETGRDDTFICEKCYTCNDRDINAAINCYKAYYDGYITI